MLQLERSWNIERNSKRLMYVQECCKKYHWARSFLSWKKQLKISLIETIRTKEKNLNSIMCKHILFWIMHIYQKRWVNNVDRICIIIHLSFFNNKCDFKCKVMHKWSKYELRKLLYFCTVLRKYKKKRFKEQAK